MQHTADAREQQSATEEWAQRWLELSIMPSFISQTDSPTLDGKDGSVRKQQSMHEYLSSPKVVVFNQVKSVTITFLHSTFLIHPYL